MFTHCLHYYYYTTYYTLSPRFNRGSGRLVSEAQVKTRLQQLKVIAKPSSLRGRLAKKSSSGSSIKKASMSSDESSDNDEDNDEVMGSNEEDNIARSSTATKKAARRTFTQPKRTTKKTLKRNKASPLSDNDSDDDVDEGSEKSTGLDMYQHFSQKLPDDDAEADENDEVKRSPAPARASSYTEPQQSIDDLLDDVSFDDSNDDDAGDKVKISAARYQSDEDEAPLLQTLIKDYNSKIAKSLSTPYKPSSKPASDSATQATAIQIVSTASSTTAIPSRKRSDINSSDGEDSVINDKENARVRVNKASTTITNKKRGLKKAKANTRDSDDDDEALFTSSTSPSLQKRPRVDLPRNIPVSSLLDNGHDSDDGTWQGEAGAVDMLSKANTGYKPSSTAAATAAATVGVSGGLKALQARAQARLTIFDSDDEEGEF